MYLHMRNGVKAHFFFFLLFLLFGVAPIDWEFIWVAGIACMALKEIWIMMIYLHFFGGV